MPLDAILGGRLSGSGVLFFPPIGDVALDMPNALT